MSARLNITLDLRQLDKARNDVLRGFAPSARKRAFAAGADEALVETKSYYAKHGGKLFERPGPTHGAGRTKTQWWRGVEANWNIGKVDSNGARLQNSTVGLAHHIDGGTIRPKRAKFLTIPLIPEAHGRRAREYSRSFGKLFRVGSALCQKDGDKIKAVYALRKSVTMIPTPGALPPDVDIADAFASGAVEHLISEMQRSS